MAAKGMIVLEWLKKNLFQIWHHINMHQFFIQGLTTKSSTLIYVVTLTPKSTWKKWGSITSLCLLTDPQDHHRQHWCASPWLLLWGSHNGSSPIHLAIFKMVTIAKILWLLANAISMAFLFVFCIRLEVTMLMLMIHLKSSVNAKIWHITLVCVLFMAL